MADNWPIKFEVGAKPGKALKRKNESDKSKYEKNRKREFKDTWQEGRIWLKFDGEKMTCDLCTKFGAGELRSSQTFIKGSTNFRYSGIVDHENCAYHRRAVVHYYAEEEKRENKQSIA